MVEMANPIQQLLPLNSRDTKSVGRREDSKRDSQAQDKKSFAGAISGGISHSPKASPKIEKDDSRTEGTKSVEFSKENKESKKGNEQRRPMVEFLMQMDEKFGVSPTELVTAFSNLSDEALQSAPEDSINDLVKELSLNSNQEVEVKELFTQMLAEQRQQSGASKGEGVSSERSLAAGAFVEGDGSILSEKEVSDIKLQSSIDRMTRDFFLSDKKPQFENGDFLKPSALNAYSQQMKAMGRENLSEMATNPWTADANQQPEVSDANLEAPMTSVLGGIAASKMTKADSLGQVQPQVQNSNQPATSDIMASAGNETTFGDSLEDFDEESLSSEQDSLAPFMAKNSEGVQNAGKVAAPFAINMNEPGDPEAPMNVKQVIDQAEYMAKKGGGEMKVKLSPEGLGDLNLKVNMSEGRINVEMLTSSNDAKKLIEKGLGDLKSTLAAHKIQVDQIKVDVSNNMTNDLDMNQEQQEQRAHQERFLDDFQRQNRAFRHGFYDVPGGSRRITSQTNDDADNSYLIEQARKQRANSRRLDLVA